MAFTHSFRATKRRDRVIELKGKVEVEEALFNPFIASELEQHRTQLALEGKSLWRTQRGFFFHCSLNTELITALAITSIEPRSHERLALTLPTRLRMGLCFDNRRFGEPCFVPVRELGIRQKI